MSKVESSKAGFDLPLPATEASDTWVTQILYGRKLEPEIVVTWRRRSLLISLVFGDLAVEYLGLICSEQGKYVFLKNGRRAEVAESLL
jgi:hypothetical protein